MTKTTTISMRLIRYSTFWCFGVVFQFDVELSYLQELSGASMDDKIADLVGDEENSPGKFSSMPAGSTPQQNGKLSTVAKEFWFPESRNCSCCKGFKHGCTCCVGSIISCSRGDCTRDAVNLPTPPPQVAVSNGTTETKTSISIPSNDQLCRFESAPGGCRFGAGCRFLHASSSTARAAGATTPKSPSNEIPCSFFQRGTCSKGDGCRFSHKI